MLEFFGYKIESRKVLFGILLLGAALRLLGLGSSELFHDEGFYAFRSIGNLDYIQNDDQTTPVQWFENSALPWWTDLSFHDHPKFYFLISNLFFRLFGDSLFVARLSSALFGILSIWLIYLAVGKILRHSLSLSKGDALKESDVEFFALASAAVLAVNHIHIWVSRSALMESMQVAAILLNICLFFVFLENRNKWLWFGLSLGACFLVKYTSAFLLPVYFIYLLIFNRDILKKWHFYASLLIALLLFTPVLIYNIYLYSAVGHFDLQLAFLFRQATPEWRASIGKIQDPFSDFGLNMTLMYSIPFLLLSFFGSVISFSGFSSDRNRQPSSFIFFGISVIVLIAMFSFVGSAYRFLTLLSPFLVVLCILALSGIKDLLKNRKFFSFLFLIFILYEIYFAIDGVFLTFPDFGVVKLDQYLEREFSGKRSPAPPQSSNPHLEKIILSNLVKWPVSDAPFMMVYDENMGLSSRLWVFTRRIYYHGISAVTTGQFRSLLQSKGPDQLSGYTIYFIKASPYTSLNGQLSIEDAAMFENFLISQFNLRPDKIIYGYDDLPMFFVYKIVM